MGVTIISNVDSSAFERGKHLVFVHEDRERHMSDHGTIADRHDLQSTAFTEDRDQTFVSDSPQPRQRQYLQVGEDGEQMAESSVVDGGAVVEGEGSDQLQLGEVAQGFVGDGGAAGEVEAHGEFEEFGENGHVVVGHADEWW